jgi:hypothetical protein
MAKALPLSGLKASLLAGALSRSEIEMGFSQKIETAYVYKEELVSLF